MDIIKFVQLNQLHLHKSDYTRLKQQSKILECDNFT
ncbi:MAG: hypothetical protein BWY72_02221 [Bacteroidetes bacterium ADurb.Bin416]|nr:MAG: hypothetical protein BWY72_02221 [Bacteroidetes bacterium ADurb.Bin416]